MSTFSPTIDGTFREYADLQLRRHHLLLEGEDNAPETELGEDRMGDLWDKLDEVQRRSLSGMGSDLNWIRRKGEPPPKGRKSPEEVAPSDRQELLAAIGLNEWHKVLHYLRLCAPMYPVITLGYIRGRVYENIDLKTYAGAFYEDAANRDPANTDIGLKALSIINKTNPANAYERAVKILDTPSLYPPPVLAYGVWIIVKRRQTENQAIDEKRFSALLKDLVMQLQFEPSAAAREIAYQITASSFEMFGELSEAARCIDEGLKRFANSEDLLVLKGLLLYRSDALGAVDIFDCLIQRATANVWPYVFLAHYNLLKRKYGDSLEMSREAWTRTTDDPLRAQLLEWQAICHTELRYPPEMVRPIFEKAVTLDPTNLWISKNFAAFEEGMAIAKDSEWQIENEASLLKTQRAHGFRELEPIG